MQHRFARRALAAAVTAACAQFALPAHALPTGEQVTAGAASVSRSGSNLTVDQSTERAAINWLSFGIAGNEALRFNQPSASSITLNRVLGPDPSQILGSLSANGQVFVLNPNGVLFGQGARVDVGGLVAASLGMSDADFMSGRYVFSRNGAAGSVVNQGTITTASGGYAALIGPEARNEGAITATLGTVALAAGDQATLDIKGSHLLGLSVDRGTLNALAENHQLIRADGGRVILTARAADALVRAVVNNDGIIEANTLSEANGTIRLTGDVVSHTGAIRARGADAGGDGGLVAISGKEIDLRGAVDTRAPRGATGTLALDPNNVEITSGAATLAGATTLSAATLASALGSNNVVVHTAGSDGEDGDIRVSEAVSYSSSNALSFLAHRHIEANASVQNEGTGALNIVAGWDGTTGFAAAPNLQQQTGVVDTAAILANTASYGSNSGSVFVNKSDGTGTVDVAVGSRHGETTIAAYDLNLRGGNTDDASAQVGYHVDGFVGGLDPSGALRVAVRNDVIAQGGSAARAFVQVGHGGYDHDLIDGSSGPDGDFSGAITVSTGRHLTLSGGTGDDAAAQLGHGGSFTDGNLAGDITVTVNGGGNLTLAAGGGARSFAQLGHGGSAHGNSSAGDISGNVRVTLNGGGNLALSSGSGIISTAQIGHGGASAFANFYSGDITVDLDGSLSMSANAEYVQIGHAASHVGGTTRSGDIAVTVGGSLTMTGDTTASAQIGHGGSLASGTYTGNIDVAVHDSLSMAGGPTQIGHGGRGAPGDFAGTLEVSVGSDLALSGGGNTLNYAMIGHGAVGPVTGTRTGSIDVAVGGEASLVDGTGANALWMIGHRSATAGGVSNAPIVFRTGTLDYAAGTGATLATLNQAFADRFEPNLAGGAVSVTAAGLAGNDGDLVNTGAWNYGSASTLALIATRDLTTSASVANAGAGDIVLAAGRDFFNTAGAGALATGGRWLVYSTSPAASTEGGLTGAAGATSPRLYDRTFAGNPPNTIAAGNHLVYSTQPSLTVSADNKSQTYGDASPAFTATISGFVNDDGVIDDVTSAGITGNAGFVATGGVLPVSGSPYNITPTIGDLASSAGYGFSSFVTGELTVTPRPVTVTANAGQAKVYGDADPAFTFGNTSLGTGAALFGALDRAAGENVGNYAIGQGTLTNANNPNYLITYAGDNFGITPRPLTIAADDKARLVGEANPPLTASFTGLAFTDTLASLAGALALSTAAVQASGPGAYAITAGGLSSANYAITYADGVLTVSAPQTADELQGARVAILNPPADPSSLPPAMGALFAVEAGGVRLPEGMAP